MTNETKPLTREILARGDATHDQIRVLIAERDAWRKVTGYTDPEALDFSLGRAGVDYHLNELAGRIRAACAERDAAVAEMNQHAECCEVAERERDEALALLERFAVDAATFLAWSDMKPEARIRGGVTQDAWDARALLAKTEARR